MHRTTTTRRSTLIAILLGSIAAVVLFIATNTAHAFEVVKALRVWPAQDYTRVTIESNSALKYTVQFVKDPERLVLDLEDVDIAAIPADANRFRDDPYIKGMRSGRFKPGVIRLVFDLKTEVKPQIFALTPAGDYAHRLVVDVYPAVPPDPLLALLRQREAAAPKAVEEKPDAKVEPKSEPAPPIAAPTPKPEAKVEALADARTKAGKSRDPLKRTLIIVIDPGHGGEDPGALGKRGAQEKHVTLSIATKLQRLIDAEPNMRAVLTRDADFFVPLHTRVEKARRARGDLFVSIHADSFVHPDANGSSVFALSERGASSVAARMLAKRENEADLIGGVNLDMKDRFLAQTLVDLSQTAQISDSLKLGRSILNEISGLNRLHKNHVEQAEFAVLKAPDIPSILVETAFISNPEEEKRLTDEAYQTRMARALLTGIKKYFARNPPVSRSTIAARTPLLSHPLGVLVADGSAEQ